MISIIVSRYMVVDTGDALALEIGDRVAAVGPAAVIDKYPSAGNDDEGRISLLDINMVDREG